MSETTITREDIVSEITLEVHICDQRRSYLAHFATEDQALAFVAGRSHDHAFYEAEGAALPSSADRLLEWLYPTCEHGLSQSLCVGPEHYWDAGHGA
jgi:hypothetical protein